MFLDLDQDIASDDEVHGAQEHVRQIWNIFNRNSQHMEFVQQAHGTTIEPRASAHVVRAPVWLENEWPNDPDAHARGSKSFASAPQFASCVRGTVAQALSVVAALPSGEN